MTYDDVDGGFEPGKGVAAEEVATPTKTKTKTKK